MIAKIFPEAVVVYTDHRFNPIVLCASVRQSTIYHPQSTTTIVGGWVGWMEPWKIDKIVPMVLPLDICVLADHYSHHYHYHYHYHYRYSHYCYCYCCYCYLLLLHMLKRHQRERERERETDSNR